MNRAVLNNPNIIANNNISNINLINNYCRETSNDLSNIPWILLLENVNINELTIIGNDICFGNII